MSTSSSFFDRVQRALWTSLFAATLLSACGGVDDGSGLIESAKNADVHLTVSKVGSGSVNSTPDGISCGANCDNDFAFGTRVTLEAQAQGGYTFVGWSGSGVTCGSAGSCVVTADAARSVTATFSQNAPQQSLALTIDGSGRVTSDLGGLNCNDDCAAVFTQGTVVTLTAAPAGGHVFSGWSGSGVSCSGTGPCQVSMGVARSVTATFVPVDIKKYNLRVGIFGSGTVALVPSNTACSLTCDTEFNENTQVTLAASPKAGFAFTGWMGGCTGTGVCELTMSAARDVTATFTAVSLPALNIVRTGSGTVTSSPAGLNCGSECSSTFNLGAAVTLTAVPAAGYKFTGWSNGCTGTGSCPTTMSASKSITATFTRVTWSLAVTKEGSGAVTSSPAGINCGATCSTTVNDGASVTLTAAPAAGYNFSGWSGGGCSGTGVCTVSVKAATSVKATFMAIPYILTITQAGSGTVTSSPSGISCGSTCVASFNSGASVTLTATPATGYSFGGWSGACSGTGACTISISGSASAKATFTENPAAPTTPTAAPSQPQPDAPVTGAPNVIYTDTLSAPTRGGENGLGGYLSVFGTNFGSASGLGSTTKVYVGNSEVANYRYLGYAKVGAKLGLQQLVVQVGGLGGAAAGTALPIKVVVNGTASNTTSTFIPTSGKVIFVSLSGSDSTGTPDDINKPYRYLQNNSAYSGAYYAANAGDQVVIRGGQWTDTVGVDGTWMRASMGAAGAKNGNAKAWIHFTAYPGPINGNRIEDVFYKTPNGKPGGIHGPWDAIAGTSGEYWAISNLRIEVSAQANADAAPINTQFLTAHWRIVNNELGPWPVAGVDAARAAGIAGRGEDIKVLGNHIHDIGGTSALENHGMYIDGASFGWEIAYNWIHDITGGSLVQFHDAKGLAGSFKLWTGSTWMGYTNMKVHNNWLENGAKFGVNISEVGSVGASVAEFQIYNNVIIGSQLPAFRMNTSAKTLDITFANNTIHNAMLSNSGSGNGYFRNEWAGTGAVRIYNNLLSFGPNTITGTGWFADYSGASSGWTFKSNLYWDAGRGVALPASDNLKVVGDPKFVNAVVGNLALQASSPAIDKAVQALPFSVLNDFTGSLLRLGSSVIPDIGAFELAP